MSISTEQWRARIGIYNGGRGGRVGRTHQSSFDHPGVLWTTEELMNIAPQTLRAGIALVSWWILMYSLSYWWKRIWSSYLIKLNGRGFYHWRKIIRAIVSICMCVALVLAAAVLLHCLTLLLIMAGDVELNPGPGMDTVLTVGEMSTLYEKLYAVGGKWFEFGLLLSIDYETLKNIEASYINNEAQRLVEVLTHRLQAGPPLTWRELCECLRSPTVGRNDIAEKIRQSESTYLQESRQLFDEAMKDGHVLLQANTIVLMGVAGSGKSSVKDLLLDNPPKEQRSSTPCRDRILNVRPVSNHLFQRTGNKWEEVSQQDMINILAEVVKHLPPSSFDKKSSDLQSKLKSSSIVKDSTTYNISTISPSASKSPEQKAIEAVINLVVKAMNIQEGASSSSRKVFGTKMMRVMDNGGQPQFHDIAPLFIRNTSTGLFVMKLTDDFNSFPLDDFYKDDKLVGTPSPSHLSHGETIMSLLRSFLSHEKNSRFVFIGTFLDEIKKDSTKVLELNRKLFEMLPADLKKQVVYSGRTMDKIIFALNACSRDDATQVVAEEIRKAVEESPSFDIEVPIWWFVFELLLGHLCSLLKRGVLRKSECIQLAQLLGFHPDASEAALVYFDEMCIAHYYPTILPDTVFVNPQVPLDKISELTQYAISLRDTTEKTATTVSAMAPKWKRFRDEGILTIDMLESKEFQKHYEKDVFAPTDMIALMKELMIIAPLSLTLLNEAETEFFMPALLRSVPPCELEEYRVFISSACPLLIRFPSGCIRCGVFCCLVVFLMKVCGWQVCLSSGEPVLLARNCVRFKYPRRPCSITLIDSFSYIEVHVKGPPPVCESLCPVIKKSIVEGIKKASKSLHYKNDHPEMAIFCPHKKEPGDGSNPKRHFPDDRTSSIQTRHFAEIDFESGYWCCSKEFDYSDVLEKSQTVWFSDTIIIENRPELSPFEMLCKRFKLTSEDISKEVSDDTILEIYRQLEKWEEMAFHLKLTPAEIEVIRDKAVHEVELKRHYMLQKWKNKCIATGTPATYRVLIQALLKCECSRSAIAVCKLLTSD